MDGLDRVQWASLHGTYDSAESIPGQIVALRSPDPAVRGDALGELGNAVVHQGTRWQVSAHVVPFLVRLIDDRDTPSRPDLVTLLRQIGLGPRNDRDLPFDPEAVFRRQRVTEQQEAMVIDRVYYREDDFDEDWVDIADACAQKWEADAYWATAQHADAYRRWLPDDPEVASPAAELLAWIPPTAPTVAALLSADTGDAVRASANLALAHLNVPPAAVVSRMTSLLDHPALVVRVTAAIALANRVGPDLPGEALDILIDAKEREVLPDFPRGWHQRAQRGFVALSLQRLGLG
ncbi:hypothetical protein OHA21_20530 [Actinoplanes sp. NBC_00393]|uniref:hypothetical protein n=1 Tax=Actinoplanes sp. NBC_00393 TaxID=2975953 RepID=UPI002E1B21F7